VALLMARAQRVAPIRTAVATVLEPVSEAGRAGVDELHEQTVNLLSFQEMPRQVFDTQVAFNMVERLGQNSTVFALQSTERRIAEHYRIISGTQAPAPSLMLIQAPIFHGHVFSIYVEVEGTNSAGDFARALAGEHVLISAGGDEVPSNVNVAGQEQILVSVRQDGQHPNGIWIWAVADNLRLQALTAVECAQSLLATRPKGKVQ
jgi:aspartate-semialdehyde dehydrogenase